MTDKRHIWQYPWRYTESILIVLGLIVVGFGLQSISGKFNFTAMGNPVNLIIGILIIVFLVLSVLARNSHFYRWFTGIPFSVSLIGGLLVLSIVMGLIPQMQKPDPHAHDIWSESGLRQVTSCWAFVLLYFVTLLSLGALIVKRLIRFDRRNYAFYLNHIGLWILLFASGLGAADLKRYVMYVYKGETEWRVYNDTGDVLELPIAIQLNDFIMEEYPPKLTVINRQTGEPQPINKPRYFQIDENCPVGDLDRWSIHLEKYIHQAVRNSDSTYTEVPMPGSTPAAFVTVKDKQTGVAKKGWVCGGNLSQLYMVLPLNEEYSLVMTQPEPKRFISDINVYTQDEQMAHTRLEVNKPLKSGSWMVYQYGYDNAAGKASPYSSFELVYDPWLPAAYAGVFLFALGSFCLIWSGNKRKGEKNDVE